MGVSNHGTKSLLVQRATWTWDVPTLSPREEQGRSSSSCCFLYSPAKTHDPTCDPVALLWWHQGRVWPIACESHVTGTCAGSGNCATRQGMWQTHSSHDFLLLNVAWLASLCSQSSQIPTVLSRRSVRGAPFDTVLHKQAANENQVSWFSFSYPSLPICTTKRTSLNIQSRDFATTSLTTGRTRASPVWKFVCPEEEAEMTSHTSKSSSSWNLPLISCFYTPLTSLQN